MNNETMYTRENLTTMEQLARAVDATEASELLTKGKIGGLTSLHNLQPIDLSGVENLSKRLGFNAEDASQIGGEEIKETIETFNKGVDQVTSILVKDEAIDVTLCKYTSILSSQNPLATASIRMRAESDTRKPKNTGMTFRGEEGKIKESTEIAVGISGISRPSMTILEKVMSINEITANIIRGISYNELGEAKKRAYIENDFYQTAKSVVYNDDSLTDIASRQSALADIAKFHELGDMSADFSIYASLSATSGSERKPNGFGDPFSNEGDMKKITTVTDEDGTELKIRKYNPLCRPAKASYNGRHEEQVEKIRDNIQILEIAACTVLAVDEMKYIDGDGIERSFNTKKFDEILEGILTNLEESPFSNKYKLEDYLGVTMEDKILHDSEMDGKILERRRQQEMDFNAKLISSMNAGDKIER